MADKTKPDQESDVTGTQAADGSADGLADVKTAPISGPDSRGPEPDQGATAASASGESADATDDSFSEPEPESEVASEPDVETDPEPEAEPEKIVERVVETRRGGFLPALLGGVAAAVIGFGVARTDALDPYLPEAMKATRGIDQLAALTAAQQEQRAALDDQRTKLANLNIPDVSGLNARIDGLKGQAAAMQEAMAALSTRIDALAGRLAALAGLDDRLTALEKRPVINGASPQAIAAYERELAALQTSIARQRAEVEDLLGSARASEHQARALEIQAADSARVAAIRVTLAQVRAAVAGGRPYAALLESLRAGGQTIPQDLAAGAETGVATLARLVDEFPAAARAALAASRAAADANEGFGAFVKRQLGARSVAPRSGDDPDAVLSRAEAALRAGDLATALAEISTLPPKPGAAMSDWAGLANARLAATHAVDALAQSLNQN